MVKLKNFSPAFSLQEQYLRARDTILLHCSDLIQKSTNSSRNGYRTASKPCSKRSLFQQHRRVAGIFNNRPSRESWDFSYISTLSLCPFTQLWRAAYRESVQKLSIERRVNTKPSILYNTIWEAHNRQTRKAMGW